MRKRWKMRLRILVVGLLLCPLCRVAAQDEYTWDMGGAIGGSFYMGDANYNRPFKNTGLAGSLMARRVFNPRMAVKINLGAGHISGDTRSMSTVYPEEGQADFSRTLFDLGAQFEYNFWGYGVNSYRGDRRFTPYVLAGMGFTFAPKPVEGVFTVNFPVGVGVKYKVAPRVNIGAELTMRFSLSDKLDVSRAGGLELNDPYRIESTGLLKNKDSYAFMLLFVTYDLFMKCKDCNN